MLENILNSLPNLSKPENKVLLILSGGLDSSILLYLLKRQYNDKVIALTFDYNQKHNIEIEKAKISCSKTNTPHKIIDLKFFGDIVSSVSSLAKNSNIDVPSIKEVLGNPQPSTYIPYRNMLFITFALALAEASSCEYIFIGVQAADLYGYWDTTPEFIKRINYVSELNRLHQIQICSPFVTLSKKEEIQLGITLGVPFQDTHSCYNGKNTSCGTCATCSERIKNFIEAGIKDPIPYQNEINWEKLIDDSEHNDNLKFLEKLK